MWLLEQLYQSLFLILTFKNVLGMFLGTALGITVGAIPGLTGTMAIALIVPFTFGMDPIFIIVLLLGTYKGSCYGGSISAILINTPGTPAASATILDGYPLAMEGKAGKALKMAIHSSVYADALSDIITIVLMAPIAAIALKFGPAEYTGLILFSLSVIAAVVGKSAIKGILSGMIGLLLATVGLDPITSLPRFGFGLFELDSGFELMPVLIGLFAVAEVFRQVERKVKGGTDVVVPDSKNPDDNKCTFSELKENAITILRGSLIGAFIGAIPGIGATTPAFINYSETKRRSKRPELFGRGSLEGVAAAESGNNGTCGPTLIPLLAFGIPGDMTTAVLLGALLIQGLVPGPDLLQKHGDIVYAIFIGMFLCNITNFLVAQIVIRIARGIFSIPRSAIFPVIFLMCCVGSYVFTRSMFGVKTMFLFGILGYVMEKLDFSPIPLLIGLILGGLFESSLRRSLMISGNNFMIFITHPIALAFIILAVLVVIVSIRQRRRMGAETSGS
jgi:putative tricarboxylic transport membrane protein